MLRLRAGGRGANGGGAGRGQPTAMGATDQSPVVPLAGSAAPAHMTQWTHPIRDANRGPVPPVQVKNRSAAHEGGFLASPIGGPG
jgi:hypothetical protein